MTDQSMELNLELILKNLIAGLEKKAYFILITTENGVVMKSYINEDEFNKASISVNISQLYEIAEEITMDYPEVAEFYKSKARISYATVFAADNGRGGGLVPAGLLKMRKEDSSRVYWT